MKIKHIVPKLHIHAEAALSVVNPGTDPTFPSFSARETRGTWGLSPGLFPGLFPSELRSDAQGGALCHWDLSRRVGDGHVDGRLRAAIHQLHHAAGQFLADGNADRKSTRLN